MERNLFNGVFFEIRHKIVTLKAMVIVIIDDEQKGREGLKNYINFLFPENDFEFVLCNSVKEGVAAINKYFPDLVFLDIRMPEANGFELFKQVKSDSFNVVFVTAFSEHIEKAVNEFGCFGYLYKPVERAKLLRIFERFKEKPADKKYFKFINRAHDKRVMIEFNDIVYCKANGNLCELYMNDGKTKHVLTKTLKALEELLPPFGFKRAHRSYIVNMQWVAFHDKNQHHLRLNHNNETWEQCIPISESNRKKFRNMVL